MSTTQNEVKIKIPANLKKQLIVDWENVTRKQLIVPVPHSVKTVSDILDEFAASKTGKGDGNESISKEVSIGLRNYFDRALGTILLYRFERVQYEEYLEKHPDAIMSNVYGAEHLLRLFVKLPALLQATKLDGKECKILCDKVQEILKYLDARITGASALFVKSYIATDKEYQDKFAQI
jgi:mortality factor 4-like protein 1